MLQRMGSAREPGGRFVGTDEIIDHGSHNRREGIVHDHYPEAVFKRGTDRVRRDHARRENQSGDK